MSLIYGHHPVVEAIQAGQAVDKVYFQQGLRGEVEKEIRHLTRDHGIPLQVVPRERLNKMTQGNHQGVVALLSLIAYQSAEELVPRLFEQGQTPLLVLLDGVTDVRNFGAICRTALCMGVHGVLVPQSGAASINEEAMKASAGALARIPVCRVRSLFTLVEWLQIAGVQVVATALHEKALPLPDIDLSGPTALLFGSEGQGVHPKLLKMADRVAIIPQATDFDSLNVGVAAGIALYEVLRQRASGV
ncbi:MAG: 23S rRNA (guanosine(2251)-2'-O)-methyltransferase RlmB [Saprospiraceae bacterium]|nr:23S rRNA (guanosine(2251)-2'-O)-methyltransferase RlmB [Saprospiraceae bacterium]